MPRRVVDRLGENLVREMIEVRRTGMKLKDVAKLYGISESSVKRLVGLLPSKHGQSWPDRLKNP